MNEIELIQEKVMPIPEQAKMIVVRDQPSLSMANDFYLTIRALRKEVDSTFDPIIKKSHEAHKEALNQKAKYEAPLLMAEKYLNGQVTAYHQEIEKKRREEAELARQKAIKEEMERRKAEEEARIAQAAELEAVGATEEANSLIQEAVDDTQKPLEVYVPPPTTQKVELEGASIKTYWQAEVTDLRALCRAVADGKTAIACVEPNMTVLNAQARALKKEMAIPGVRAVPTSSMASTGKRRAA